MTRLVVCEHFTAGGGLPGRDPAPLRREGRAMLLALLADLRALDGPPLAAVVGRHAAGALPPGVEALPGGSGPPRALTEALAEGGGASWVVAPETRGILARLTRTAERQGRGVVGSPAAGVRAAALRLPLLRRLARAGVPVPATAAAPSTTDARRALQALGGPAVVKPARGAGGAGTTRVEEPGGLGAALEAARSVEPHRPPLLQAFVPGTAASATLLVGPDGAVPLALNGQRVRFDPAARYEGGRTPLRHPAAGRALRIAAAAVRACGGLRGLVGVDLVLGADGPVVLEVNPRLTTAYLGLRAHLGPRAAGAALRVSGCFPGVALPATGDPPAAGPRPSDGPASGDGPLPATAVRGPPVRFDAGPPAPAGT